MAQQVQQILIHKNKKCCEISFKWKKELPGHKTLGGTTVLGQDWLVVSIHEYGKV